ncbi:MAG: polysaccharide deacetylase family protein, partial [Cellulosilyticum sp.]|nr:polysaccharide deacetylase family protein [Cellulosilyticum sp.]
GKIYNYFSGKKSLVVRDEIKLFYGENVQTAAKEITASYYLLATKYPAIETIFSPYVVPDFTSSDAYSLNRNDSDFYLFYTIYSRLLEKPWLSDTNKEVCSISPYQPIEDYDVITDTTELILNPDSDLLPLLETKSDAYAVYFKWNNELLNINLAYPFAVAIEPINGTNGISRLSVVVQSKKDMEHKIYAIDLEINHTDTVERAQRIPSSTTLNANGIIADDTYIPILMYHTVEDEVLPEDQNSHVETEVFDSQMKALIENGYTPINFYDLKNYVDGLVTLPEHPILITMDDGYLNNYTNAYPIYKKYNIQATLFVSPYYMKEENTERHFGWIAAQEMEDSGLIDIQPHGYDHTPLPYLSLKDARYHASHAKGIIEKYLGTRDVSVLAYPQFRHNRHTVKILNELGFDFQIINLAKKGILPNDAAFNPPKLKRINVPNTMTPEELLKTLDEITR